MTAPRDDEGAALSPLRLATVLLRGRIWVLRLAALSAIVVATSILLRERQYTARASVMPQARRQVQGLSGLAAQFGLAVPSQEGVQNPAFYVDLLLARQLLGDISTSSFRVRVGEASRDTILALYLGVAPADSAELRERGFLELRNHVGASQNTKTGVVNLSVTTRDPELSAAIAQRLLDQLDAFNQERRRSQATAERQFTERRLAEVREELREAEERQLAFLQRNRDYRGSPELSFQQDRLAREVAMRQQVFTSLAQAYEQSRIDEVRDTPVLSIVEAPTVPPLPDGRGLVRYTLVALLLGAFGTAAIILLLEIVAPGKRAANELDELLAEWGAARADLRNPIGAFFRRG